MATNNKEQLLIQYSKNKTKELRDSIIIEYSYLVKIIANKLYISLAQMIEKEDLESFGIFGLIDAIDRYNVNMDVKFETYASLRIRGNILDEVRKLDWLPRSIREKEKEIEKARKEYFNKNGVNPNNKQLSNVLHISEDELLKHNYAIFKSHINSLDNLLYSDDDEDKSSEEHISGNFPSPEIEILKKEVTIMLEKSLSVLTKREEQVIKMYYYNDLTFAEISHILDITQSRTSQLHSTALMKMKKAIPNGEELLKFFN